VPLDGGKLAHLARLHCVGAFGGEIDQLYATSPACMEGRFHLVVDKNCTDCSIFVDILIHM
jgi:hypothetical protein